MMDLIEIVEKEVDDPTVKEHIYYKMIRCFEIVFSPKATEHCLGESDAYDRSYQRLYADAAAEEGSRSHQEGEEAERAGEGSGEGDCEYSPASDEEEGTDDYGYRR